MQHRSTNGSLYILHIHVYVSKGIHKYVKSDACIGLCINSICMSISRCKANIIGFHALELSTMGYHSITFFPFAEKQHNPPGGAKPAHQQPLEHAHLPDVDMDF